jgi:hypothetical protein
MTAAAPCARAAMTANLAANPFHSPCWVSGWVSQLKFVISAVRPIVGGTSISATFSQHNAAALANTAEIRLRTTKIDFISEVSFSGPLANPARLPRQGKIETAFPVSRPFQLPPLQGARPSRLVEFLPCQLSVPIDNTHTECIHTVD